MPLHYRWLLFKLFLKLKVNLRRKTEKFLTKIITSSLARAGSSRETGFIPPAAQTPPI